jgi:hypothetical protein
MLSLKKGLGKSFLSSIYRSYVSIININADVVKKIKILPDEYENSYQESEIRVEAIDGDKNLIKLDDSNSKITKTKDEFNLEWLDKNENTSIIVEIPLSSCRDIELNVNIETKGKVQIENIPTSKSVDISTNNGRVMINQLRTESLTVAAPEMAIESVYAMTMDLKGTKKVESSMMLQMCQIELLRAIGKRVSYSFN